MSSIPGDTITLKDLSRHLKTKAKADFQELRETVDELVRGGLLEKDERGRMSYIARRSQKKRPEHMVGRFVASKRDGAYVELVQTGERVKIAPRFVHTALHGDTVAVVPFARASSKKRRAEEGATEGEVADIVKRAAQTITGTLRTGGHFAFVVPDNDRITRDIYVPREEALKATDNDKVVVALQPWTDEHLNPEGTIVEVLGPAGDAVTEVLSVARSFNLQASFPVEVEQEAAAIPSRITDEDLRGRLDLRKLICMTIDPEDAKDFDDAVSIEDIPGGKRLGVHIADVSHYVREGTLLDEEAYARGTSVYLVNEVIPMLPERLSNDLCSLRPDEDRLTYSAMMDVADDGSIAKYEIRKSVIHSSRRYSYEQVQKILDDGRGPFVNELQSLWALARVQLKKRKVNGSLDFDTGETKFAFDAEGLPTQIVKKVRMDAHRLIEECMLLANRVVASHIGAGKKEEDVLPFIYRVHDLPDQERLVDLANFVKQFGFSLDAKNGVHPKELQKLLDRVIGSEVENVIHEIALRAMAKAIYSQKNIGHYGLAFTHYTHFTSPIRRYPDLIVHRLLESYTKGATQEQVDRLQQRLPEIAKQSSDRERVAMEAERASIKVMQAEYMKRHIGDEFKGVIVGVTKFGLFVEINELFVEGLVHIRDLADDYYLFDEKSYSLRGRSRGKTYRLGDDVRIRVLSVSPEERQIQFVLA